MSICKCPASTALPDVPVAKCAESFGQIQKIAFQRLTNAEGVKNKFEKTKSDITKLASWTPLLTATDGTKVVVSPYIQAPTTEAGDPITFGGGNDTLGGIEEIVGRNPTTFTAVIRKMPQDIIKALKEMQCESWSGDLGIFIFDENGAIGAIEDENTAGSYYPIPIRSLFVGDKVFGGLEAPDSNNIQWSFAPNYSDDLVLIVPEFNPLTDLVKS